MGSIPERSFDESAEGGSPVISERTRERREALARTREMRRRALQDPEVQARSREVLDEIARGDEPKGAGITEEDLPGYLHT